MTKIKCHECGQLIDALEYLEHQNTHKSGKFEKFCLFAITKPFYYLGRLIRIIIDGLKLFKEALFP